jgi:hypothetical protein
LATVDSGGNGRRLVVIDDHAVFAAEIAVEPARIVVDAMVGGEQRGIDLVVRHPAAHIVLTPAHFGIRKRRELLFTVVPVHHMQHVVGHRAAPLPTESIAAQITFGHFISEIYSPDAGITHLYVTALTRRTVCPTQGASLRRFRLRLRPSRVRD